ncbi:hypothetical protein H0H92_015729 [Tricholoma furcatifolium]|nr:hypothetical protein H0H92_015729 [Tricholoma furcatifolium]
MRKQFTQNPALAFFDADKLSKGKRTLHASEFWSKTNYKEKVEPLVKAELAASNVPANRSLLIIKRHIRAAFDAEPEASRQLIYAEIEEAKVRTKAETRATEETTISQTPAQVAAHHAGTNKLDHNFSQAHVGYKENFVGPYVAFVRSCYTQRDLDTQALMFQHQTSLTPERPSNMSIPKLADTSPSKTAAITSPKAPDVSFVPEFAASAGLSTTLERDCHPNINIDPILYMMPSQAPESPTLEPPAPIVLGQQPATAVEPSGMSEAFPFGPVVCPDSSDFIFPDDMFFDMTPSNPPSPANPPPFSFSPELSSYFDFFNTGPRVPALVLNPTPDSTAEPVTGPVTEPGPALEPSPVEPSPTVEPSPFTAPVIERTTTKPSVLMTVEEGRRGSRIRKGARPRDAPTLTLDAEGVQVVDAYGRPVVPQKRKGQKENKRPAKCAQR